MALVKFLLLSLAVFHASFDALPVNALVVEHGHLGRGLGHAHADIVKKRDSSKKCRPRPTSASSGHVATTTSPPYSVPSSKSDKSPKLSESSQPAQTTTSPQSSPSSTPSSSGGGKILLGWSNDYENILKEFVTGQTQYIYNWQMEKYAQDVLGDSYQAFETLEFIPTIHSAGDVYNIANTLVAGYAKRVFTFNEPEINSQANLTPQQAFQLWKQYIQMLLSRGFALTAPALTGAGVGWFKEFLALCNGGCGFDALNIHVYSVKGSDFIDQVNEFHQLSPLDIWIGEVGCQDYSGEGLGCPAETFNTFYNTVMTFADSSSFIKHVGWYGLFSAAEETSLNVAPINAMIDCSNTCTINELGKRYVEANPNSPY